MNQADDVKSQNGSHHQKGENSSNLKKGPFMVKLLKYLNIVGIILIVLWFVSSNYQTPSENLKNSPVLIEKKYWNEPVWTYNSGYNSLLTSGQDFIKMSSDGTKFVAAYQNGIIMYFNLEQNKKSPMWNYTSKGIINKLLISNDGSIVLASFRYYMNNSYNNYYVVAFNGSDGNILLNRTIAPTSIINGIDLSNDGNWAFVSTKNGTSGNVPHLMKVKLFNIKLNETIFTKSYIGHAGILKMSPNGKFFIGLIYKLNGTGYNDSIIVYSIEDNKTLWISEYRSLLAINFEITGESDMFIFDTNDGSAHLFYYSSKELLMNFSITDNNNYIRNIEISDDGDIILLVKDIFFSYVFNVNDTKPFYIIPRGGYGSITKMSGSGQYIIIIDEGIYSYSVHEKKLKWKNTKVISGQTDLSHDGQYIIVNSRDGTLNYFSMDNAYIKKDITNLGVIFGLLLVVMIIGLIILIFQTEPDATITYYYLLFWSLFSLIACILLVIMTEDSQYTDNLTLFGYFVAGQIGIVVGIFSILIAKTYKSVKDLRESLKEG